jgi:hypothetical protein
VVNAADPYARNLDFLDRVHNYIIIITLPVSHLMPYIDRNDAVTD